MDVTKVAVVVVLLSLIASAPAQQKAKSAEFLKKAPSATEGSACDIDSYGAPRVTHFIEHAITRLARPEYPADAAKHAIEGSVNVDILIDRDGTVVKACAVNGPAELRKAAEAGALSCRFKKNFGLSTPSRRPYQREVLTYLFVVDPSKTVDERHYIVVRPTK